MLARQFFFGQLVTVVGPNLSQHRRHSWFQWTGYFQQHCVREQSQISCNLQLGAKLIGTSTHFCSREFAKYGFSRGSCLRGAVHAA